MTARHIQQPTPRNLSPDTTIKEGRTRIAMERVSWEVISFAIMVHNLIGEATFDLIKIRVRFNQDLSRFVSQVQE